MILYQKKMKRKLRLVESHSGARETFLWGPFGEKMFEFFSKWCILVHFILVADGGTPNLAEPGVAYPPTPPSRRACTVNSVN